MWYTQFNCYATRYNYREIFKCIDIVNNITIYIQVNESNQSREPIRTCRSTVMAENLVHLFDGHHNNLIVIKLNQHRSVVRSISHCKSVMYAIFKSFISHFPSNLRLYSHVFARCFFSLSSCYCYCYEFYLFIVIEMTEKTTIIWCGRRQ